MTFADCTRKETESNQKYTLISTTWRQAKKLKMSNSAAKGCFITQTSGLILLFLAVVLTVGVGLIVHFTSTKSGATHCNCIYPASTSGLPHQRRTRKSSFVIHWDKKWTNVSTFFTIFIYADTKNNILVTLCNCLLWQLFSKIKTKLTFLYNRSIDKYRLSKNLQWQKSHIKWQFNEQSMGY